MLHITPTQYRFMLDNFHQQTFGALGDLETEVELIGQGLDATLQLGAVQYDSRHSLAYAFYRVELLTFIDGGKETPNDFDPQRFIELHQQSL